jgi:hypothetical protein
MYRQSAQWILWAVTMIIFTWLTLTGRWDWLTIGILASTILWYGIVPRSYSSHNRGRRAGRGRL